MPRLAPNGFAGQFDQGTPSTCPRTLKRARHGAETGGYADEARQEECALRGSARAPPPHGGPAPAPWPGEPLLRPAVTCFCLTSGSGHLVCLLCQFFFTEMFISFPFFPVASGTA